jgi:hypothetical protein
MKKALVGVSALALVMSLAVACTESPTGRTGEGPAERPPAASPPTVPGERRGVPTPQPPSGSPASPGSPSGGSGGR